MREKRRNIELLRHSELVSESYQCAMDTNDLTCHSEGETRRISCTQCDTPERDSSHTLRMTEGNEIATGLRPRNDKPAAFSVLELLIMLVAVSVILAAFMPVITKLYSPLAKKVEASVQEEGTPGEYIIPQSQSDCPSYSVYTPGRTDGEEGGYCVTKWNIGDDDESGIAAFAISNGQKLTYNGNEYTLHYALADGSDTAGCSATTSTSEPFGADSLCCWGRSNTQTASSYTTIDDETLENPSTYSGRARTVCTWQAAMALCDNFAPKGMKKGDWHAPTQAQLRSWRTTSTSSSATLSGYNSGPDGLQLCDNYSGYSAVQCDSHDSACTGTPTSGCYPYLVWSRSVYSSSRAYRFYLASGTFSENYVYPSHAFSVRCLAEKVPNNITDPAFDEKQKFSKKLETTETLSKRELLIDDRIKSITVKNLTSAGGEGGAGYCAKSTTYKTPESQDDCPKDRNGNDYTVYIKGTCVAKWNMGDSAEDQSNNSDFALPDTVKLDVSGYDDKTKINQVKYSDTGTEYNINVIEPGATSSTRYSCKIHNTALTFSTDGGFNCWQGKTSGNCTGDDGAGSNYSGCNRTVCDWHAAVALCENWSPYGTSKGDWQLPDSTDIWSWRQSFYDNTSAIVTGCYLSSTSTVLESCNKGPNGLQLCDKNSSTDVVRCGNFSNSASGQCYCNSTGHMCYPNRVMEIGISSSTDVGYSWLNNGALRGNGALIDPKYAGSVRCLIKQVPTNKIGYYSGGGGASGAQSTDIEIPSAVINSAMGGKVVINRDDNFTDPNNTSAGSIKGATVLVYNNAGELIWGYLISHGAAGSSASSGYNSSTGAFSGVSGGSASAVCKSYNKSEDSKFKTVSCSTSSTAGGNSTSASLEQKFTSIAGSGASLGSSEGAKGYNHDSAGATPTTAAIGTGGGGGGCKEDTSATNGYSLVAPTTGGIGYVELEYRTEE